MTDLTFAWSGTAPSDILGKTFTKISVVQAVNANPLEVIIWMPSDTGLRIRSRMHDIAERKEVGVLEFSQVRQSDWSSYLETVELAQEFQDRVRFDKLVLESEGMRIECGLALGGSKGGRLVIVPSDYPGALAIDGADLRFRFGPEYPLGQYEEVPLC
jgi:hypothetical protein